MKVILLILLVGFSCANRAYNIQRAQDIIDKQNAKENSWEAAHNKFSFMSLDEKKQYLGLDVESLRKSNQNPNPANDEMELLREFISFPETFDWRNKPEGTCIGDVRD